ncbi:MAG: TetR/AcrR family transcriptional regulator [Williamsia herbipolensis]|uniref:Transcriptional regulator, TetR family n=2 Tax=Williamsia serinedens TaxID=391736 RepID=A0ABT1H382_9NOCA|nr:TetR/AcrR family transcriptional regulator [Williamsia serinedens]MBE7161759.1 TetR/AcrR family transcriptional regulator [Williamsia herbipolensis]MCP2161687.1 transcriptional regulator, TetR family [Williamsia serinedens]
MPRRRVGGTPQDEILDAAGELFTEQGYAGTSTRAIAEAVGLRQASLYHHFATKEDILIALLRQTVVPTLDVARAQDVTRPAADRLVEIVRFDVTQLVTSRWNLGVLYLLPEIRTAAFDPFRADRLALRDIYRSLAAEILGADARDPRCALPFRLVESVIGLRSDGEIAADDAATLAGTIVAAVERILRDTPRG